MGAVFASMVSKAKTVDKLKDAFEEAQEQDRYENGHLYSGGIGMARGLVITDEMFPSLTEAEDWLENNTLKWECAKAVKVKDGDSLYWVVGAICCS
jgi:hypothetical protein